MSIEERVRGVIAQVFSLDKSQVPPTASQETLEKWDSFGHMNLCVAIEEEFKVSLDDTHIVEMTSVPKVVQVLSGLAIK
jgi:acyl carrier protein